MQIGSRVAGFQGLIKKRKFFQNQKKHFFFLTTRKRLARTFFLAINTFLSLINHRIFLIAHKINQKFKVKIKIDSVF